MEPFSALLAFCAGNSPVTGEFPSQRPVTRSFDVFFDVRLNKRLSKQSWCWWFETPSRSLCRHRNALYNRTIWYTLFCYFSVLCVRVCASARVCVYAIYTWCRKSMWKWILFLVWAITQCSYLLCVIFMLLGFCSGLLTITFVEPIFFYPNDCQSDSQWTNIVAIWIKTHDFRLRTCILKTLSANCKYYFCLIVNKLMWCINEWKEVTWHSRKRSFKPVWILCLYD